MLKFNPKEWAKELKAEMPEIKRMTVEVCDSDGALCVYVRDEFGDPIGYHDTGLNGDDDETETQELADALIAALNGGLKKTRVEAKAYDHDKDPESQWDEVEDEAGVED